MFIECREQSVVRPRSERRRHRRSPRRRSTGVLLHDASGVGCEMPTCGTITNKIITIISDNLQKTRLSLVYTLYISFYLFLKRPGLTVRDFKRSPFVSRTDEWPLSFRSYRGHHFLRRLSIFHISIRLNNLRIPKDGYYEIACSGHVFSLFYNVSGS